MVSHGAGSPVQGTVRKLGTVEHDQRNQPGSSMKPTALGVTPCCQGAARVSGSIKEGKPGAQHVRQTAPAWSSLTAPEQEEQI